ncbi:MAG: 50S ribosomal protein L3 [Candidatus Taylorbacteria bacterium RIFOXYD2_FULL_36_9]|uniref:50S ribosomal protein L3 n=1 Tax=Candidatus Taylorbacteria bacterium RIFOXYD2_FULL_36_9 TaxID=1802338 RepID=A0A1G2PGF8_9BACT|nr:MAG: 50S ribosomal protein L3 [Candidatus Taylorbacteria bacterium RIFOXYD2_FULL_36_9]
MKFILGVKKNMTQVFDDKGNVVPVTVLEAGPVIITQIKTEKVDGYNSVQVGFGVKKEKNINKAVKGHLKSLGNFRFIKEFRIEDEKDLANLKVGDKIDLTNFKEGDKITVSSISKGKGFQGVIKRHGFKGQPRTHGQKHSERAPGSISGGTREGGRVPKGMRMGGRTGSDRVTISGLKIIQLDQTNNELLVLGAMAGKRGTLIEIVG